MVGVGYRANSLWAAGGLPLAFFAPASFCKSRPQDPTLFSPWADWGSVAMIPRNVRTSLNLSLLAEKRSPPRLLTASAGRASPNQLLF